LFNAAGGNGRLTMKKEGDCKKVLLFTIGFAQKSAEEFFSRLKTAQIKTLIDIRLNNNSQLAGFTKKEDLRYFLKELCDISYKHMLEFAPTEEILDGYKKKTITWEQYETKYNELIEKREIADRIGPSDLHMACFLCSEPTADKCHRRLLAEYFNKRFPDIQICHL